ncbi:Chromosome (plasmid) partitioning protein ParB [hydrothermal vent metagenome]|uniref:Chromosome (Plasmid) partitioning protein ParB n=1 Tax=hydrothermal vent metagenome TaxID=652676 RepID=A0A3B0T8Q8_9ZZZZ
MNQNQNYSNSIFWIEVEKINPNPYQPRKEFDEGKLRDLAESIKQYGILQPLVATRREREKEDGGLVVEYELIAGERRLRASKIANLVQVPVIIRSGEDDDKLKLELAIIENLQREDLNPVDRARAFQKLADEFRFKHVEIAKKIGKSREYVSNTLRLLALPEEMLNALAGRKITEGHTRPILMLADRPEEQVTLFKEIIFKKLTVREAEGIARRIAQDRVRKKNLLPDPEIMEIEDKLTEELGTRVQIDRKETGGKIMIDFFSNDDLRAILSVIKSGSGDTLSVDVSAVVSTEEDPEALTDDTVVSVENDKEEEDKEKKDEELYGLKNFSL